MIEIKVLKDLFQGNPKVRAMWDPVKNKAFTSLEGLTDKHWQGHIEGQLGIGQVPIHDDGNCWFGALDIDNHGAGTDGKPLDLFAFDSLVSSKGLPLVTCRSKSGGIHAYVFFDKPTPAQFVQVTLRSWSSMLGYPRCEIFPKQTKLKPDQAGNWINLPYFDAKDTQRYAVHDQRALTFEQFAKHAGQFRTNAEAIRAKVLEGHEEAPPCIQSMIMGGIKRGQRNDAMFVISVYSRKVGGDDWQDRVKALNGTVTDSPVTDSELDVILSSVSRQNYGYRCTTEPCLSLCDRKVCLTREYGIGSGENKRADLPAFTDLVKHLGDPVRWSLKINDVLVSGISSQALLDPLQMGVYCLEASNIVLPAIKRDQWQGLVTELMLNMRIIQADASSFDTGKIEQWLGEFVARCDFDVMDLKSKENMEYSRTMLRQDLPIIREINGDRVVAFKLMSFTEYLKKKKYMLSNDRRVDIILEKLGIEKIHNVKMGGWRGTMWYAPVENFNREHRSGIEFKPEI